MAQHIPALPQDVEDRLVALIESVETDEEFEAVKAQIRIEAQRFREELYDDLGVFHLDDQVNYILNTLG